MTLQIDTDYIEGKLKIERQKANDLERLIEDLEDNKIQVEKQIKEKQDIYQHLDLEQRNLKEQLLQTLGKIAFMDTLTGV